MFRLEKTDEPRAEAPDAEVPRPPSPIIAQSRNERASKVLLGKYREAEKIAALLGKYRKAEKIAAPLSPSRHRQASEAWGAPRFLLPQPECEART